VKQPYPEEAAKMLVGTMQRCWLENALGNMGPASTRIFICSKKQPGRRGSVKYGDCTAIIELCSANLLPQSAADGAAGDGIEVNICALRLLCVL
jgi:hypothetical protein